MKLPARSSQWLKNAELQRVIDALEAGGGEARVNGGAIRNSLLGEPVSDIDLSTTLLPGAVMEALKAAGIKAVPTGIEHGTVTAVLGGQGFEITTLREDVETFGRHARVEFGTDWHKDAERRDFTMNALYCDRHGEVLDPLGGLADAKSRTVRFIGLAEDRIREDYLRILRFFRFFAWYGDGRPDANGLKACGRLRDGLAQVSVERVWHEFRKLLSAPDPGRALLWMRTTGVLTVILPESEKWGIDLVHPLIASERLEGRKPDPLLRLEAMVRPDPANLHALSGRLRLSGKEAARLQAWAASADGEGAGDFGTLQKMLYRGEPDGITDRLKLRLASLRSSGAALEETKALASLIRKAEKWKRPDFPVTGAMLMERQVLPGPGMGEVMRRLEAVWIDSGFRLKREELLAML